MGKKWQGDSKERWKDIREESTKPKDSGVRYPTKKTITGNITSLGVNVYYLGGNAEKSGYHYQKTTDKIAEYVQNEYGGNMWILITTQAECKPTEPQEPTTTRAGANSWAVDRYKLKYSQYLKLAEIYDNDKAKTFAVIYGQCTETMKNKLKSFPDHSDVSRHANVIKLLQRIKKLMLGDNNEQYHYWLMTLSLNRMVNCKQGNKESLESFYARWTTQLQVHESKWGAFTPSKVFGTTDVTQDKHKFQACLLLNSLSEGKYGKIITSLNNSFLQGNKSTYPNTPDDVLKLVTQWMGTNNIKKSYDKDNTAPALNFLQVSDDEDSEHDEEAYIEDKPDETEEASTNETPAEATWQF